MIAYIKFIQDRCGAGWRPDMPLPMDAARGLVKKEQTISLLSADLFVDLTISTGAPATSYVRITIPDADKSKLPTSAVTSAAALPKIDALLYALADTPGATWEEKGHTFARDQALASAADPKHAQAVFQCLRQASTRALRALAKSPPEKKCCGPLDTTPPPLVP